MTKVYELRQRHKAAPIFGDWEETIIWSCLQNVMGDIYVDDMEHPDSAMAILGDFSFFAGLPDEDLVAYKPAQCKQDFMIMVPQNTQWSYLIEKHYQDRAKKTVRYAFKKEKDGFDKKALKAAVAGLSAEYRIEMIDAAMFTQCKDLGWSRDLVSQYDNYEKYQECGLGAVILKDDEIVSGASSYSSYIDGIEIEIDTREDYRRKGLAYVAGAKLILACLERGWYPSWDAHDLRSAALAEKLGYRQDKPYPVYIVERW